MQNHELKIFLMKSNILIPMQKILESIFQILYRSNLRIVQLKKK